MDFQGYQRELANKHVDLLGVQTTTPTIKQALAVGKITKELHPECTVTMGDITPPSCQSRSWKTTSSMSWSGMRGNTLPSSSSTLSRMISPSATLMASITATATASLKTPKRRPIEDLDALPFPARHLLPMSEYMLFGRKQVLATMICSRGCPMGCSFCASSAMHGRRVRFRSPENAADEMETGSR